MWHFSDEIRMLCSSYTDPRLAAVYDQLNPSPKGVDFYLKIAGNRPRNILDMGCGTGRLACALAKRGHIVTGVDPAAAMLDIARNRKGGQNVRWIETDAARLSVEPHFDLIIMTGHVFQVFLDDRQNLSALRALFRHLTPGGRLAFETRNPEKRIWENWTPTKTKIEFESAEFGPVTVHYDVTVQEGQQVTFETHYLFAGDDIVVTHNTIRFVGESQLREILSKVGFLKMEWFGNWDSSALESQSQEIIVIATRE